MDVEKYLKQVLEEESLSNDSSEINNIRETKKEIEEKIKASFDESPTIRYAGSYKKGTMIKANYDLDIVCYFDSEDDSAGSNLEEIYNNVKDVFTEDYSIEEKKSALRLKSKDGDDFHIDLVPGRFVDDSKTDCFLYQSEGEKNRLKTNLDVHISHIKDSGLIDTIKLIKVWKNVIGIDIKTFILELLVVKLGDKELSLEESLKNFWKIISNDIENISIEDPANSNNDLTLLFGDIQKNKLSIAAKEALKLAEKGSWEEIFKIKSRQSNQVEVLGEAGAQSRPYFSHES
jgi:tRNA nucleotidyltransferase (CCA-adding enzyme)